MHGAHAQSDSFKRPHPYAKLSGREMNGNNDAYLRLLFCTRMNSQSTMARTPVLNSSVSLVGRGANLLHSHPSNAHKPMTSRLAMRSLLCSLFISLHCLRRAHSILRWYHSS